jgi:hypothetical protein
MSLKQSFSSSFILTLVTGKLHIHVFYNTVDGGLAYADRVNKTFYNFLIISLIPEVRGQIIYVIMRIISVFQPGTLQDLDLALFSWL